MIGICVLGISGSVGSSTVKVLRRFPSAFQLISFSVHSQVDLAKSLIREFSPEVVCITDPTKIGILGNRIERTDILYGEENLSKIVELPQVQKVVTAIVGSIGAKPTIQAIKSKKQIALANKETLVTFGPLIQKLVKDYQTKIIPVDSEHNALFQLLENQNRDNIDSIVLTASGGSFRNLPMDQLAHVTVSDALNHPTWKMGPKITVDSAGMVNKALEVIEAHFLFGFPYDKINVVIHPESLTHGMVAFQDGAYVQYTSHPDMEYPIASALFYPNSTPAKLFDRTPQSWKSLNFWEPDPNRYPALALAYQAGMSGGTAPAILNAANEVAVDLFLKERIPFVKIPKVLEDALNSIAIENPTDWEGFWDADQKTRNFVTEKYSREVLI